MAVIPMANCDLVALVDDEDVALVSRYRWAASPYGKSKNFYAATNDGRTVYMHRLIAGVPGFEVDHRNCDGLDNRRSNLRTATRTLNLANQRPQVGRLSIFKGVSGRPSGNWRARIQINGEERCLGTYRTQEEAARAYDTAAIEVWGEFARPNFPQEAGS